MGAYGSPDVNNEKSSLQRKNKEKEHPALLLLVVALSIIIGLLIGYVAGYNSGVGQFINSSSSSSVQK